MADFVTLQDSGADKVGIIRFDRPKVNAINPQFTAELLAVAKELEGRDDLRSVVMWGGPKIFAAGADIGDFPHEGPPEDRDPSPVVEPLLEALLRIENLSQVTIAAVNGFALGGGCEMSMSTDFRIAGESAVFGQPEILLGIIPGGGGTQRLTRLVGVTKSKDISYSGRMVKADEALEIGLVSEVVPDEQVLDRSVELATQYANAAASIANVKKAIMDGLHLDMESAMQVELREFKASFQTDDAPIGIKSFLENGPGKATFTGK